MGAYLTVLLSCELFVAAPDAPKPPSPCTEGGCHGQVSVAPKVHEAVRQGKCEACHRGPGLAQPDVMFNLAWRTRKPGPPLPSEHSDEVGQPSDPSGPCRGCHQSVAKKMRQYRVHAPAAIKCLYCHDPHGSASVHILRAPPGVLCPKCHEPVAGMRVHEPVSKGQCTACHDPHASPNPMLLVDAGNGLCTKCHERWHLSREKTGEPCRQCHVSHASNQKGLLRPTP